MLDWLSLMEKEEEEEELSWTSQKQEKHVFVNNLNFGHVVQKQYISSNSHLLHSV